MFFVNMKLMEKLMRKMFFFVHVFACLVTFIVKFNTFSVRGVLNKKNYILFLLLWCFAYEIIDHLTLIEESSYEFVILNVCTLDVCENWD